MSNETVVLITGANRGLGLGLANLYLQQPNTKVILTTRTSPSDLRDSLPKSFAGTLQGIYKLDSSSTSDATALRESLLLAGGVSKIDIVIANAGISEPGLTSVLDCPIDALEKLYQVNTLGPVRLYQQLWDQLLSRSETPKFILISSVLACLQYMDPTPCGGYGASKVAANYLVRKIHLENEKLVAVSLHPGWVKTANGQSYADAIGVPEPPLTSEQSVNAIFKAVTDAEKHSTSGKFIDVMTGQEIPW